MVEMAGVYVHIPFCKSRCVYCGFFSTTQLEKRVEYVERVCEELRARRSYLNQSENSKFESENSKLKTENSIATIYFGGGTPTQLRSCDIGRIVATIGEVFDVSEGCEVTVEGNPDDLTAEMLRELRATGVNRLSMGVQTFDDTRLRFLNRRHTSAQAVRAVEDARRAGFDNVSIDLMFGFPGQTVDEWRGDVARAIDLGVQHISAYSLMYEEGTRLGLMLDRGEVSEVDEEVSAAMYEHLMDALRRAGFEHYEISNFALPGFRSRHNSSYWRSVPYLGVGAGAHSYDGLRRHYNPDSLSQYMAGAPLEEEALSADERYNEFVFTGLRTCEGVSMDDVRTLFGDARHDYCLRNAQRYIAAGRLSTVDNRLRLTRTGLFVSNDVMSDLMLIPD